MDTFNMSFHFHTAFEVAMWDAVDAAYPVPEDTPPSDAEMDMAAELAHAYCAL